MERSSKEGAEAEQRARYERFRAIDSAFRAGDLAALRAAVVDPGSPARPDVFETITSAV